MSAPNGGLFSNLMKLGGLGLFALPVAVVIAGIILLCEHRQQESRHQPRSPPPPPPPRPPRPPRPPSPPSRPGTRRRWSTSTSSRSPSLSPERRNARAISPAPPSREAPQLQPSASTSQSSHRREETPTDTCKICDRITSCNPTILLDCGHVFHDECYTVWRYVVERLNPLAKLCPSCMKSPESS